MLDANEVTGRVGVSFLVQFFGIHEITDSFDNRSLLVSQLFKDKIDEVSRDISIQCIFVFQDVKSLVGYGDIVRKDEAKDDAGQEPFEIEFKWTKLVMLPYSDISTDDTDFIVSAIGDEQDATWELKEITEDQRRAIVDAIDRSAWETTDSMVSRFNSITSPTGAESEKPSDENEENDAQQHEEDGGAHNRDEGRNDRKRERSRDRSSRDRSGSRSRQSSRAENAPTQETPRRTSRIPFDVTKMSYDQYCAKHYSYAIDMYRAEKLAQYNQAQAARAMAMGIPMGLPVHLMNQASMGMQGMGMQGMYGMNNGGYGAPVAQGGVAPGYGQQQAGMGQGMQGGYGMGGMGMPRPQMPMGGGYYGQQGSQTGYGAPVQTAPAPQLST